MNNIQSSQNESTSCNKKQHRVKKYNHIDNNTRKQLLELVKFIELIQFYLKDYKLAEASKILNINYSTAKTILRVFKLERRIKKKKTLEEEMNYQQVFGCKQITTTGILNFSF